MTRPGDRSGGAGETALAGSTVGESGGALKAQAPNSPNINQIAKALSDAQREAILRGKCGVPPAHAEWSADCLCGAPASHELMDLGLAHVRTRYPNGIVLNDLGLQVRTQLKGLPND